MARCSAGSTVGSSRQAGNPYRRPSAGWGPCQANFASVGDIQGHGCQPRWHDVKYCQCPANRRPDRLAKTFRPARSRPAGMPIGKGRVVRAPTERPSLHHCLPTNANPRVAPYWPAPRHHAQDFLSATRDAGQGFALVVAPTMPASRAMVVERNPRQPRRERAEIGGPEACSSSMCGNGGAVGLPDHPTASPPGRVRYCPRAFSHGDVSARDPRVRRALKRGLAYRDKRLSNWTQVPDRDQ